MFGKSHGGSALVIARETHEGSYRKGINIQAPTGLYHHVYDFIVDVTPDDGGAVFRTTIVRLHQGDTEYRPVTGDTVRVKLSKDNEAEFDKDELWNRAKAAKQTGHDKFAAIANAAPGAGAPIKAPEPTGDPKVDVVAYGLMRAQRNGDQAEIARLSAELERVKAGGEPTADEPAAGDDAAPMVDLDRLAKLAELHKQGVLTNEEFAEQKAKILG